MIKQGSTAGAGAMVDEGPSASRRESEARVAKDKAPGSWADDARREAQWQKQIDYGKNTLGYQTYLKLVPKDRRKRTDPVTPDISKDISKKRFDGQMRVWRRVLHQYDETAQQALKVGLKASQQSSNPEPPSGAEQRSSKRPEPSSNKKRDHKGAFNEQSPEGGRRDEARGRSGKEDAARTSDREQHQHKAQHQPEPKMQQRPHLAEPQAQQDEAARASEVLRAFAARAAAAPAPEAADACAAAAADAGPNIFDMIMNEGSRSWMDFTEEDDIQL